ncbi:MAG: TetR/AcrR family transcriptional regulator [Mycobacterium sp.]
MDAENAQWSSPSTQPAAARELVRARSVETRRHIIRAGRDAFCTLGYESATLKEIARRANVSRPTVNYHFSNKDDLYRAIEHEALTTVLADSVELAKLEDTFLGQLQSLATSLVAGDARYRSHGEFLITSVLESARSAKVRSAGSATTSSLRAHLTELVSAAVDRGQLGPDTDVPAMVEFGLATLLGMGLCVAGDPAGFDTAPESTLGRRRSA